MGVVMNVGNNTSKGVVMLKVCGEVIFVKAEKTDKGRHYKRLQLLSNGGAARAVLYDVTDMENAEWTKGSKVELPCSIDVYTGKRGPGYSLTYWGAGSGDAGAAGAVSGDAAADRPGGAAKSGGKFGGQ